MDYSPTGSSVHGILQARILEWVAIPFSRGSSWPTDRTHVPCIAGRFSASGATREALLSKQEMICNETSYGTWGVLETLAPTSLILGGSTHTLPGEKLSFLRLPFQPTSALHHLPSLPCQSPSLGLKAAPYLLHRSSQQTVGLGGYPAVNWLISLSLLLSSLTPPASKMPLRCFSLNTRVWPSFLICLKLPRHLVHKLVLQLGTLVGVSGGLIWSGKYRAWSQGTKD